MTEYRRLDDICNINMGQSPASDSYNEDGDGLPFFQGNADFGELYPEVRIWCNAPTKIVEPETLLISVRAPIGALNFSRERSCIGRGLAGITPMPGIELKYVYYCLKGKNAELNAKGTGSTFKAIAKAALGETSVRMISLLEQQEIIQMLDKLSEVIRQRRQQLAALDTLIKARFVEMFGDPVIDTKTWGQHPLGESLKSIRYGTSKPPEFSDTGYAFIRATNIKNGRIIDEDMKYISEAEASKIEKCKVHGGELIIVRSGVNSGDTCVITDKYKGQYAGYDMILEFNDNVEPEFVNTLINTSYMEKIVKPLTRRAAQPHLNAEQVQGMPLIDVPIDLQNEFIKFVQQADKSKAVVQKALDEAQTLFDSLMQQYFG